jgi:hypothetical protein
MDVEKRLQPNNGIPIAYDLASHHALGGGSYVFKRDYPSYLKSLLSPQPRRTEANISRILRRMSEPFAA